MTYETKIPGDLSFLELKKLISVAVLGCLVIAFMLGAYFRPFLYTVDIYYDAEKIKPPIIYNFSNIRSDMYDITGDIRLHGDKSTIFIGLPSYSQKDDDHHNNNTNTNHTFWTMRPYARKDDPVAMNRATQFKISLRPRENLPKCNKYIGKDVPALVFSTGGYSGNPFHAFTDLLVPLFLTSKSFDGEVVFLVTDKNPDWPLKYKKVLDKLTRYSIYEIDREKKVLCFTRMIIGLRAHPKELRRVDPSQPPHYSATDFTRFLREAYSLPRNSIADLHETKTRRRPRMIIIWRRETRLLLNRDSVIDLARKLGFDVVLRKMVWNVAEDAESVNTFDVMVGVHGAGLTNMVFLPEKAVVIQITVFGLDYMARICFERAAGDMGLRYLEYKVRLNESSLLEKYRLDLGGEFADPRAVIKESYDRFKSVYLDQQDITLDLQRFRGTLLKALALIRS